MHDVGEDSELALEGDDLVGQPDPGRLEGHVEPQASVVGAVHDPHATAPYLLPQEVTLGDRDHRVGHLGVLASRVRPKERIRL